MSEIENEVTPMEGMPDEEVTPEELSAEPSEELSAEPSEELSTEPLEELSAEPSEELSTEPAEEAAEELHDTPKAASAPEEPVDPEALIEQMYRTRKPYKDRYYLLYGNEKRPPEKMDLKGTLTFLKGLGFGDNALKKAREEKDLSKQLEAFTPKVKGGHYCDFCGKLMTGAEYEVLKDGRERCPACSRSVVKTEKEFVALFGEVLKNMKTFFNIEFKEGIDVRMVNAKTLHKKLKLSFVPTANPDGRVLGVAIKDRKGLTLLIENGSPRMAAIKTMAHELTHIWQYQNWNAEQILRLYGRKQNLEIYEGMAKWAEIQYCFLLGEAGTGKRAELETMARNDEYGRGFMKYCEIYPLSYGMELEGSTPFEDKERPL